MHSVRLHPTQNYYTQLINRLHNFPFDPFTHQSVVALQPKNNLFLTSNFGSTTMSGQIYDNTLQVRRLTAG